MDQETFQELIQNEGAALYGFCLRTTRNAQEAQDLYQDTFLAAWEKRRTIDRFQNPRGFLMAIAVNLWKNRTRKMARHMRIAPGSEGGVARRTGFASKVGGETAPLEAAEQSDGTELIADERLTEDEVIRRDEAKLIRQLTSELPEKLRLVVYLHYTAELTEAEIGKVLKIPVGTVKSRLFRAKRSLQKELEERGYEV